MQGSIAGSWGTRVRRGLGLLCALVAVIGMPSGAQSEQDPVRGAIVQRMEHLQATRTLSVGDAELAAFRLIPVFYEQREFKPAWTDPADVEALIRMVGAIDAEGLDPEDYHLTQLRRSVAEVERSPGNPEAEADLDILLTDSLIRLGYHLRFGKVNPELLDPDWNLSRDLDGQDPAVAIQGALDSPSLERALTDLFPRNAFYRNLQDALERYREIEKHGGWPTVPDGPVLKPGMSDDRMPVLRERLARSGDFAGAAGADSSVYDADLVDAVVLFQERHGLDPDGAIGKKTLAALNVSAERRVDQIRVNLERARWVLRDLDDEFVIVNIAGFRVRLVRNGEILWSTRAQVGKTYRKTPVFKSKLSYIEFNPTWTVPPTILAKDVLPAIRRDPGYLRKKNMKVIDSSGKAVDPSKIDWNAYASGKGFPYSIRQEPGPNNALGQVKFIFPNKHFVFLHDTPSRGLFDRAERTFSSGCIRVEHPLTLAELLLEEKGDWDAERIEKVIDSKKTQRAHFREPLTVLLLYWTVGVDESGAVRFLQDVYGRDQAVVDGLEADFEVSLPRGLPDYLQD